MPSGSLRPLALWFLVLGVLALVRVGARHARGAAGFDRVDAIWLGGGALLAILGLALLLRRAR